MLNSFRYQNRWKLLRAPISQLMLIKFIAFDLKATLRHFFARTEKTFFSHVSDFYRQRSLDERKERKAVDGMSSESKFVIKIKTSLHHQLIGS